MNDLDRAVTEASTVLEEAGVSAPSVDAELLAGHVLGLSRGEVQLKRYIGISLSEADSDRLVSLVQERARRVPLQHLTGCAPFRHLELRVGPGVFIPRPETEQVVQVVLDHMTAAETPRPRVVDLGTGSGAIAASIASEYPDAEVHAVELSEQASAWAELNLAPHGVKLHRCDLREFPMLWRSQAPEEDCRFDVVVSNPPYIPGTMVPTDPEVRDHDPQLALYGGGADGLEMPRAVMAAAVDLLRPSGWLILEHAEVQTPVLRELMSQHPLLEQVHTHQDLAGRDRATSAVYAGAEAQAVGEYTP